MSQAKHLSGKQYEKLDEALRSAYPSSTLLARLVRYVFNIRLSDITSDKDLTEITFQLIAWAEASGKLDVLIDKAHKKNPGNKLMQEFHRSYFQNRPANARPQSPTPSKRRAPLTASKPAEQIQVSNRATPRPPFKFKAIEQWTQTTEADWLAYFKFERSPFERLEAGSQEFAEPGFLNESFVDPVCFRDVLGQANAPTSTILYARRGDGKTACRVYIDYLCLNGGVPDMKTGRYAPVWSIPHIHLHSIAQDPTLENHVVEILHRAMSQLIDLVLNLPNLREQFSNAPKGILLDLSWYVSHYNRHLTAQQEQAMELVGLLYPFDESAHPQFSRHKTASPLDHLEQVCRLAHNVGIMAVYVLVDGVDEDNNTASDSEEAYRLIAPLLTNRDLIDKTPYLALKAFLPSNLEELVRSDKSARPELIPSYHITWSTEKLIELVRRRILAFRQDKDQFGDTLPGLEQFCTPELYGIIEGELLRIAGDNPRNILKFFDVLIETHCQSTMKPKENPYLLTPEDLRTAEATFGIWLASLESRKIEATTIRSQERVRRLIGGGESETVEFKFALIRDEKTNQPFFDENTKKTIYDPRGKIVKEVAGMLNSAGGSLLIGVKDDLSIVGIEDDYQFLPPRSKDRREESRKADKDGFRLLLVDLIKDNLGAGVLANIDFNFVELESHTVCEIFVRPFLREVYYDKAQEFYIRSGSSNLKLTPSEMVRYISEHWKKT